MFSPRTDRSHVVAGIAWLGVAVMGLRYAIAQDDEGWHGWYILYTIALLVGALTTVLACMAATERVPRPGVRRIAVVVGAFAVLTTLVAWALPFWMSVLAIAFGLFAIVAPARRRILALMAGAQIVGIPTLVVLTELEVGRADEYGDRPVAAGLAILVTAVLMIAALGLLAKQSDRTVASPNGVLVA